MAPGLVSRRLRKTGAAYAGCMALIPALLGGGCDPPPQPAPPSQQTPQIAASKRALSPAFITRGELALEKHLSGRLLLEFRASPDRLSAQVRAGANVESIVQFDYVELAGEPGQPPVGNVLGPVPVPVKGSGDFEGNLFPYEEIKIDQMVKAFDFAVKAIDPLDGRVERLIVRRNLPFGKRVRGRIFVASPRLPGSIDVNEKGTILKR